MKTKTKFAAIILFSGLILFGLQSCDKYPENSLINLQSRTERVANNWRIDNYKVNDADYTSLLADYTEKFTKSGDYSYSWGIVSGTGTWAFQNNDREVQLTGTSNQDSHTLVILKLEENAFWYYYMDGNDKKEFHLIPVE